MRLGPNHSAVLAPAVPAPTTAEPTGTELASRPAKPSEPEGQTAPSASQDTLDKLAGRVADCQRCALHAHRQNLVFGEGNPNADLMFVGEAPGAREDQLGRPFVGPAGQLLTKIIENAVGMPRDETYIANINKCRPPGNRTPEPDEVAACLPLLKQQIELIRPKLIVALGKVAAVNLLGITESVTKLRRRTDLQALGVPVVVTWHPAYLLRTPAAKSDTWTDIKRVNQLLGRPEIPGQP